MYAKYKNDIQARELNERKQSRILQKRLTWYEMKATEPGIICVGIDLGNITSGYAYSFHRDFQIDPSQPKAPSWTQEGRISMKTPSSVLLDEQQELLDFGYSAEEQYIDELDTGKTCYLFKDFKAQTLEALARNEIPEVADVTGKIKCPAKKIFSTVIKFFSDHFAKKLQVPFRVKPSDIYTVFTVPEDTAIVTSFYKTAALEAGLLGPQILYATEAEAALRYYSVNTELLPQELKDKSTTVLIVDAGGRDVNLTYYKKDKNRIVATAHATKFEGLGFLGIADSVRGLLDSIFKVATKSPQFESSLTQWLPEIERVLLSFQEKSHVTLRIPMEEFSSIKAITPDFDGSEFEGKIRLSMDRIRIAKDLVENVTRNVLNIITAKLKELFRKGGDFDPDTLLLVGGVSNQTFFQSHIDEAFPNKNICVSEDTANIVVKGAVIYGHQNRTNLPVIW